MNIVSNQKITEMATVTWSFPPWANAALSPVVYSLTPASGKAGSTQSPRDQVPALRADEEAWALASTSLRFHSQQDVLEEPAQPKPAGLHFAAPIPFPWFLFE